MDSAGAKGPDTLPPMPQGKEAGGEGQVPRALIRLGTGWSEAQRSPEKFAMMVKALPQAAGDT